MGKFVFITGTGTGVGKTTFSRELLCWLRSKGIHAAGFKPVETGYEGGGDGSLLEAAAGSGEPAAVTSPYQFKLEASPHLAAKMECRIISRQVLFGAFQKLTSKYDVVVAEGAGGIMVPLNESFTIADLVKEWKAPVIVVCPNVLGAINHTLLTLDFCAREKIEVLGYVLNRVDGSQDPLVLEDNPRIISGMTSAPFLGEVPHLSAEQLLHLGKELTFMDQFDLDPLGWWLHGGEK